MDIDFSLTDGVLDWRIENGDLATGHDIRSAVTLSLFTDAKASLDYTPTDGSGDRRGSWTDAYDQYPIGSTLWQLERRKISDKAKLLVEARDACRKALQWMIREGIVQSVNVTTSLVNSDTLNIEVAVVQPDKSRVNVRYHWAFN